MNVYQAIAAVTADIAKDGISKGRRNQQQNYNFRGIDDVYNALSPIIAKHGLCILPRVLSRELVERLSKKGDALFYVTVEVEFDFVSAEDGSKHTIKTYGEAMDSADKATNKAMSAAYKYAAIQAFCIPTEGDNDADATTHEVEPTVDWVGESRELAALINACPTLDNLGELWKTPRAQRFAKNAPADLAHALTTIKDQKKQALQKPAPVMEAAE